MNTDNIQHKQNDRRGIFFLKQGEQTIAELTYSLEDDVMTIDHTEVQPEHENQGLGGKMIEESYAYAKANNLKDAQSTIINLYGVTYLTDHTL